MIPVILFWILLAVILYCYLGYAVLLLLFARLKRIFTPTFVGDIPGNDELPGVTVVIAAYNEREIVHQKVKNMQSINYPPEKLKQVWVTDGSDDGTPELLRQYPGLDVLHWTERRGKASALNHAMEYVKTPITIFSDANTMLAPNAVLELVKPFNDHRVGCVTGEKQVIFDNCTGASSTGEGMYWKYESFIKQLESETGSTLSAVGELFAIRTALFSPLKPDVILDDFEISTRIALGGKRVLYSKNAIATENGSLNFEEEYKRKVRIAAGSFQTLFRSPGLLNLFKNFSLTFKYISHKVLRWTVVPLAILLLPILTLWVVSGQPSGFYLTTAILVLIFYLVALLGFLFRNRPLKFHALFLPYYLLMMHIAEMQGFWRYLLHRQDVRWEKSKRET